MNTGGPAFPTEVVTTNDGWIHSGMTLRDYFAAKAMQGLLIGIESGKEHQAALIPKIAYDMADVMLKAREQ